MKKLKGMTLVEIIVSIALLGLLAACFLPALAGNYKLIIHTREITRDSYTAQEKIEQEIESVKDQIKSGGSISGKKTYVLFQGKGGYETTVTGYVREFSIDDPSGTPDGTRTIYTVIGDTKRAEYKVAEAQNVVISLHSGGDMLKNAYVATSPLLINSSFTIVDPDNVNLTNIYRWYVSREGFNLPLWDNPEEVEIGKMYPRFPDDYSIIPGATSSSITSILKEYAGKHIVFTITPASKTGKMGETVASNTVYLSGLPIINNLKLHLDASSIDTRDDEDYVRNMASSGTYIAKWPNIADSDENGTATQPTNDYQPQFFKDKFGTLTNNESSYDTYGGLARFNGSQYMTVPSGYGSNMDGFTVFVAVKCDSANISSNSDKNIVTNGKWSIRLDASNHPYFYMNSSTVVTSSAALNDSWNIIRITCNSGDNNWNANTNVSMNVNGTDMPIAEALGTASNRRSTLTIGNGMKIDIGEMIIYSDISAADISAVERYLNDKYNPD